MRYRPTRSNVVAKPTRHMWNWGLHRVAPPLDHYILSFFLSLQSGVHQSLINDYHVQCSDCESSIERLGSGRSNRKKEASTKAGAKSRTQPRWNLSTSWSNQLDRQKNRVLSHSTGYRPQWFTSRSLKCIRHLHVVRTTVINSRRCAKTDIDWHELYEIV